MYLGSLQVPANDPIHRSATVCYYTKTKLSAIVYWQISQTTLKSNEILNSELLNTMTLYIPEFVPTVTFCVGQTSTLLIHYIPRYTEGSQNQEVLVIHYPFRNMAEMFMDFVQSKDDF